MKNPEFNLPNGDDLFFHFIDWEDELKAENRALRKLDPDETLIDTPLWVKLGRGAIRGIADVGRFMSPITIRIPD